MRSLVARYGLICTMLISCACGKGKETLPEPVIVDPLNNFFKGEVKPMDTKPCFAGAYYRKMVSSTDYWLGIGGKVVLPTLSFDPLRTNPAKPGQYLDNPSVYIGGSMGGQETDIGLTWEVIRDANGNVTAERKAFRPFLRRTSHNGGQAALYENAPASSEYYWYPGEEVEMSVQVTADKKIKFIVEGAGKRFERDFDADGYKPGNIGEFKRVNAIDQVSNEGKPVQATKTKVEDSQWKETYLFRSFEGKVVKAPAHSFRLTDMRCPSTTNFSITRTTQDQKIGAEKISISGAGY